MANAQGLVWGPIALLFGVACGDADTPVSGGGLRTFDAKMVGMMARFQVEGAALALVYRGRLVAARGYGFADETREVEPNDRFRIASVSKPITAAAILQLVEQGRISLDDHAVDRLAPLLDDIDIADDRFRDITIGQLLHHTAGWDRDLVPDPMFDQQRIMDALRLPAPPTAQQILRWLARRRLQFTPGTRFAYHNLNYLILGRIIEQVSGQTYADYVQTNIFSPAGIMSAAIGGTLREDRQEDEVAYFYRRTFAPSIFDPQQSVPVPYGGMGGALEPMDSHGGWIMSAVDMARFGASVDGESTFADVLSPQMQARVARDAGFGYGAGWFLNPPAYNHTGGLPGTATLLMVDPGQDTVVAIALNSTPIFGTNETSALYAELFRIAAELPDRASFADIDLFDRY